MDSNVELSVRDFDGRRHIEPICSEVSKVSTVTHISLKRCTTANWKKYPSNVPKPIIFTSDISTGWYCLHRTRLNTWGDLLFENLRSHWPSMSFPMTAPPRECPKKTVFSVENEHRMSLLSCAVDMCFRTLQTNEIMKWKQFVNAQWGVRCQSRMRQIW